MNINLRDIIRRIAWKRIALIMGVLLLIRFYLSHRWYLFILYKKTAFFFRTLTIPLSGIGNISHGPHSEAYELAVLCAMMISVIAIIKLLKR